LTKVLFDPSVPYMYYHSLIAFHNSLQLIYFLGVASIFFNILSLIPLYCFIYDQFILSKGFWLGFLALRIVTEIYGHNYDVQLLKSLFHTDLYWAMSLAFLHIIFLWPSYVVCYKFAFPHKEQT